MNLFKMQNFLSKSKTVATNVLLYALFYGVILLGAVPLIKYLYKLVKWYWHLLP